MKSMRKIYRLVQNSLAGLYLLLTGGAAALVLTLGMTVNYAFKATFLLGNAPLLALTLSLAFLAALLVMRRYNRVEGFLRALPQGRLELVSAVLFFFQVYVCFNIYFAGEWDVMTLYNNGRLLAHGTIDGLDQHYFSLYPNNVTLLWIFAAVLRLNDAFGVLDAAGGQTPFVLLQCFLSCWTGVLIFRILRDWTHSHTAAWCGWGLYLILLGTSPWLVIPYSDSMGLWIPTLIFRLYQTMKTARHKGLRWFALALLAFFGCRIKPQMLLVFIAIVLVEAVKLLFGAPKGARLKWKRAASGAAVTAAAVITASAAISLLPTEKLGLDDEYRISPLHYVMMGLNNHTDGAYWHEDWVMSSSIPLYSDRTAANIRVIKERVGSYGFAGLVKHTLKKALVNYGDGTFAWGGEGGFYAFLSENKNTVSAPLLKAVTYNEGALYPAFSTVKQAAWLFVLTASCAVWLGRRGGAHRNDFLVLMTTLVGLALFQMVFEARARYLFIYAPFYILLGTVGWTRLMRACRRRARPKRLK